MNFISRIIDEIGGFYLMLRSYIKSESLYLWWIFWKKSWDMSKYTFWDIEVFVEFEGSLAIKAYAFIAMLHNLSELKLEKFFFKITCFFEKNIFETFKDNYIGVLVSKGNMCIKKNHHMIPLVLKKFFCFSIFQPRLRWPRDFF